MWYFLTFQEFYDTNLTGINKVENQVGSVFLTGFKTDFYAIFGEKNFYL